MLLCVQYVRMYVHSTCKMYNIMDGACVLNVHMCATLPLFVVHIHLCTCKHRCSARNRIFIFESSANKQGCVHVYV